MFTKDFDTITGDGDAISCEVDGFLCYATAHHDSDTLPDADNMEQAVHQAWLDDEWFYVGIVVTVYKCNVKLTGEYAHALWGVECNLTNNNGYLREVANELLPDALTAAKAKIRQLVESAA